jgi:hypothetical protein
MRTEPDGKVTACKADSSGFDSHSALRWEAGLVPQSGSEPVPPVRSIRTFPANSIRLGLDVSRDSVQGSGLAA